MDYASLLLVEDPEGLDPGLGLTMLPWLAGGDADDPAGLIPDHDVSVGLEGPDLSLLPSHDYRRDMKGFPIRLLRLWSQSPPSLMAVCKSAIR